MGDVSETETFLAGPGQQSVSPCPGWLLSGSGTEAAAEHRRCLSSLEI